MVKGLSATELRSLRLKEITNTIRSAREQEKDIDAEAFIFQIQMKFGLTEGKAREYYLTANKIFEWENKGQ